MKDFDTWNNQKKEIDKNNVELFFKEREIWWVRLGLNIGFEQDGKGFEYKRPVLVIKKFSKNVAWCVPLSTVKKENIYYVDCVVNNDDTYRAAIISQLKLIDTKRFEDKIGRANEESFKNIKKSLKELL